MNRIAKEKSFGSVKRFGPRYGRTLKYRLSKIEAELKKKHKCPYCNAFRAKRISVGIWECTKCNSQFTGRAYTIGKKVVIKEKTEEKDDTIILEDDNKEKEEKGKKYSENKKEEKGEDIYQELYEEKLQEKGE